ncbi:enoyl-CoA hydratase/isomerase family protein [Alisedimentitalea sp. MJ-SS2]|uniref:enoyl-CoA hydratase/isomerase family protein n=1 Tax=Aliisedimentitalea sp. MJ-SS2 TaxID=3049795 RepID=UPI0029118562|nr:enoyl-CoA hydratase/isomerase family protein [Alisedimentitalea sp. MJ-SS2]MDU8929164.1 enoyl-CoA hydratase/isomerase family protein [Alisedimentitalea sp. MJ-SS2]
MSDISVRIQGRAGRITLQRPKALNAVTYEMVKAIDAALDDWRNNDEVALIVIDAEGDKAFSAGGDIADLYATGKAGDFSFGQTFWRDEYRMNAKLHEYEKPVVSFLQGFTMGGGMGVGCHGSHRIVGESSQIAMPECGIGLVPDVGGSMILAHAPGHLGAYLGTTGTRMGPADAILVGFADLYIPQGKWPSLIQQLEECGDASILADASDTPPSGQASANQAEIDQHFSASNLPSVVASLEASETEFAGKTLKALLRSSPLSTACTLEMMRQLRTATIREALQMEYRFTFRAMEHGDFIEGIRAAIIDKDRNPQWQHDAHDLPRGAVETMLAPLGDNELTF